MFLQEKSGYFLPTPTKLSKDNDMTGINTKYATGGIVTNKKYLSVLHPPFYFLPQKGQPMNVIKMRDINGNKVMVERQEMFMALFQNDDNLVPANFFWKKYKEMISRFLCDIEKLQEESAKQWADFEARNPFFSVKEMISYTQNE
jgi:hypothetical protein